MSNISGNIALTALTCAFKKSAKGTECLIIPLEENHLKKTEKGNVYMNISAREHINEERKQTHIVSQSVPKDAYEKLRENDEYPPTLGNLTDWSKLAGSGEGSPNTMPNDEFESMPDDLPF